MSFQRKGATASSFFGGVKVGAYKIVGRPKCGSAAPLYAGSIDEYCQACPDGLSRRCGEMLFNKVKECPQCGKPNGYTLSTCNQCRHNLSKVPLSTTPNLFSAFVLGIEKGPKFPLNISIRHEADEVLVFDDPLALAPLHFCAIPTKVFIPDWRYLTLNPKMGLEICKMLEVNSMNAAKSQFFSDEEWKRSVLREATFNVEEEMLAGFNFPPSQNQIHIQYMLPVLMPHQHMLFLRGVHYTFGRFFPLPYVKDCLEHLNTNNLSLILSDLDVPCEDFVLKVESLCGVSYKAHHETFMEKATNLYEKYANWEEKNFDGCYHVTEEGLLEFKPFDDTEHKDELIEERKAFETEKAILQTYGKNLEGVKSFGFYSFPKQLKDVDFSFLPA